MIQLKASSLILLSSFIVMVSISCQREENIADRIVMVGENDKEMEAAGKAALSELPLFWERFSKPQVGDDTFSVKVVITDSNGTEYFWLTDISRSEKSVSGVVDQQPQIVKNVKHHQRIEVGQDKIIDWLFMANGKMKGNFTLRPLLKSMPKDDLQSVLPLVKSNPSIRDGA